jgi:hypothetical protein
VLPMNVDSFWTPERVEQARQLYDEKRLSARKVGAILGTSRNAVISAMRRYAARVRQGRPGVPRAAEPKPPPVPKAAPRPPRPYRPTTVALTAPAPLMARLVALPPHGCRWPVGYQDGEHRFCGAAHTVGSAYCAYHAAMGKVVDAKGRKVG